MTLRWIAQDDPLYAQERRLRFEVLRAPLGMPEGSEENPREAECAHCVAIDDGRVVGCVLALRDEDPSRVKLLQMAVAADRAGQGVGALLVRELERRFAAEFAGRRSRPSEGELAGVTVYMHARVSARGFYERLGYAAYGELFSEVGLPHVKMARQLD